MSKTAVSKTAAPKTGVAVGLNKGHITTVKVNAPKPVASKGVSSLARV